MTITPRRRARTRRKPELARDVPRSSLVNLRDWRAANAHLFATDDALRWHLRHHRDAYIRAGALIAVAGRYTVDAPLFEATLREIGQRIAAGARLDLASAEPPVLEPAR